MSTPKNSIAQSGMTPEGSQQKMGFGVQIKYRYSNGPLALVGSVSDVVDILLDHADDATISYRTFLVRMRQLQCGTYVIESVRDSELVTDSYPVDERFLRAVERSLHHCQELLHTGGNLVNEEVVEETVLLLLRLQKKAGESKSISPSEQDEMLTGVWP